MEHIAALLLIVACSDDLSQCRELPAPTPLYEAEDECRADLQPAIDLFVRKHPKVLGQCVFVDPAMDEEDAELVWHVKPDGTLFAAVQAAEVVLASTSQDRRQAGRSQE